MEDRWVCTDKYKRRTYGSDRVFNSILEIVHNQDSLPGKFNPQQVSAATEIEHLLIPGTVLAALHMLLVPSLPQ